MDDFIIEKEYKLMKFIIKMMDEWFLILKILSYMNIFYYCV